VVANATKGAILAASIMEALGYDVCPAANEVRFDIIQAIKFGNAQDLISFCKSIQMSSPVDAFVLPEPADMPGYQDKVIMAGGTFIEGSTIELSADGPLRAPFAAYLQGGLTYYHCKLAMLRALEALLAQEQ
jgi:cystathionine beta-lyase family protein involved in aluminum resistance